jgi:hypothetical protein
VNRWLRDASAITPVRSMFGKSRVAVAAVMVLGVAGMLAGPWASPASATLAPIRCFGECSTSSASTQGRVLSKHGNWSAVILGTRGMVVHEFDNGAKFAIVAHPNGEISLLLMHPDWRLQRDQRTDFSIDIDGHVFRGTSVANQDGVLDVVVSRTFVVAFYRGNQALIEIGEYRLAMTALADAAAAIDDVIADLKSASR